MTTKTNATLASLLLVGAGLVGGCSSGMGGARAPKLVSVAAPVCTTSSFPIYFERGSDQLTRDSVQVLRAAAQGVSQCSVSKLDVVGLASGLEGSPEQAKALAERRSTVVADALKATGLPAPRIDLGAVGAAGSRTSRGRSEPLRRRTEVIIYAGAQATAAR